MANQTLRQIKDTLQTALIGPQMLAFVPAVTLGGYWFGGEGVLLFMAFLIPGLFAALGVFGRGQAPTIQPTDPVTELPLREGALMVASHELSDSVTRSKSTIALAIGLDEVDTLANRLGPRGTDQLMRALAGRLRTALRDSDYLALGSGPVFLAVLGVMSRSDLETVLQLASRLQRAVSEPFSIDGMRVYGSVSVGACLSARLGTKTGTALIEAAEHALADAQRSGTSAVRDYSPEMKQRAKKRSDLESDLERALDEGQIVPWFQPQVHLGTAALNGVEALARWHHPERGFITPGEFLPVLENAGLSSRLGEVILRATCKWLSDWDQQSLHVPHASVNFSADELRNPEIVARTEWELDRFGIEPQRLSVEVLETVIASTGNDTIVKNLWGFSELGCQIDLDDFGTGHAAIGNIRRFAVDRIKIDRSFVSHLDKDEDQQSIVAAILTMAERLGLETLAEGVETVEEMAVLNRLGCQFVQGYGVARPMPGDELKSWANTRPDLTRITPATNISA